MIPPVFGCCCCVDLTRDLSDHPLTTQATLIREVSAIKGSLVIAQPGRMTKMSILSTKEPIGAARAPIATPEIVQEVVRRRVRF